MAATQKSTGKAKKTGKVQKKSVGRFVGTVAAKARQVPKTVVHYGDVVVWQPYKAYWRWGQKLASRPREALSDIGGGGRRAASEVGKGARWGLGQIRHYGGKVPGVQWAGEKVSGGIRAFPSRLKLVGSEDIKKLNKAVDSLTRKVEALAGKAAG